MSWLVGQKNYRSRSRLVRPTLDDAATLFAKCSIDILHIDVLHTYEAVKRDFETWLLLLAEESIVLFHNINVRERDFGVWKLWQQLSPHPKYLTAEVLNGHGLGILAKGPSRMQLLFDSFTLFPLLIAMEELLEMIAELTPGGSFTKTVLQIQAEQARTEAEQVRALLFSLTSSKARSFISPFRKMGDFPRHWLCSKLICGISPIMLCFNGIYSHLCCNLKD